MKRRKPSMQTLWAPWRMDYIKSASKPPEDVCFLCEAAQTDDLEGGLVVHCTDLALVLLNRYPYNNGHLLVAPRRHEAQLEGLTGEELSELMALTVESKKKLDELMHPHGYNVGINLGRVAGAGLEAHLHFHIVPRWSGDTNFFTSVGSTKVIPQSLEELWRQLTKIWA